MSSGMFPLRRTECPKAYEHLRNAVANIDAARKELCRFDPSDVAEDNYGDGWAVGRLALAASLVTEAIDPSTSSGQGGGE